MQENNVTFGTTFAYGGENALNITLVTEGESAKWVPVDTTIGLVLAFSSCFFIGISVIVKKLALKDLEMRGGTRAVDGGYGYLRLSKWWLGISLMALGELTNFVAYIFAPAILVTPLGVFSIVCTATLSPYFLKEKLNSLGKLGCILVLVGCVIVTLCGPKDREVSTMEELQDQLLHPGFLIYASIVVGTSAILMALVPRFGYKYVMFYITICSSFGSLSVMFCKGVGLAIKQTIIGHNEFTHWATWVCLVSLIGCLLIETIYMQRALDLFNSSVFMSVNYVMFTSMVIIASSILYTELAELGWKNIILTILGFVVNIVALYLLHLDKSQEPSDRDNQNNCPDQDPETPLMIKNNNNNNIGKEGEAPRGSPLANIGLSPNLFREGKSNTNLLSFLNKDCISEHPHSHIDEAEASLSSRSSISCNDACSHSSRSNVSENSIIESPDKDEINIENQAGSDGTHPCICEIPLVTELQSTSRSRSLSSSTVASTVVEKKLTNEAISSSRPCSEVFSDTDEVTKLV